MAIELAICERWRGRLELVQSQTRPLVWASGGIGRRAGFRCQCPLRDVGVQVPLRPQRDPLALLRECEGVFFGGWVWVVGLVGLVGGPAGGLVGFERAGAVGEM